MAATTISLRHWPRARHQTSLVTNVRHERREREKERQSKEERNREREETRERIASRPRILPRSSLNSSLFWMSVLLMTHARRDFYVDAWRALSAHRSRNHSYIEQSPSSIICFFVRRFRTDYKKDDQKCADRRTRRHVAVIAAS